MTFKILFIYAYALAQLHLLSITRTVTVSAAAFLFMAGALFCLPVAYLLQSMLSFYGGGQSFAINACVEEIVKVAPLAYLLWRTRAAMYAGVVDGLLCGAAIGAGFGFAEDVINAIETASESYSGWASLIFTWLPGGWTAANRPDAFFPGHLVLTGFTGAGVAAARRLVTRPFAVVAVAGLTLAGVAFVHVAFNAPGTLWPWLLSLGYNGLLGGGAYAKFLLLAVLLAFIAVEQRVQRQLPQNHDPAAPELLKPQPLDFEISLVLRAFGDGRQRGTAALGLVRKKRELVNLEWFRPIGINQDAELEGLIARQRLRVSDAAGQLSKPLADTGPLDLQGAIRSAHRELAHRSVQLALRVLPTAPNPVPLLAAGPTKFAAALPSFIAFAYRAALLVVLAEGLYLVFISPFLNHAQAQVIGRTTTFLVIGIIGQILVVWSCASFLLRRRTSEPATGTAQVIKSECRLLLAWGGLLTNVFAWKFLYDSGTLPYPFRPADAQSTVNLYRSCYGSVPAAGSTGPLTGPIPPLIGEPGGPSVPPGNDDEVVEADDPGLGDPGGQAKPEKKDEQPIRTGGAGEDFGVGGGRRPPPGALGDDSDLPPGENSGGIS